MFKWDANSSQKFIYTLDTSFANYRALEFIIF